MLKPAEPLSTGPGRGKRHRLNRRKQFNLLIVRGDAARVLRVTFPRRLALGAFAVVGLVALAVGAVLGDYVQLRALTRDAVSLSHQVTEQRVMLDSFNRRVGELRTEVGAWRELHGRIWEAFGPDTAPRGPKTGIGGAALPLDRTPGRSSPADELHRLAETIKEEGENLRALDRLMLRAGKVLAALPSRWPVRGAVNSEFGMRLSPWTKASEFHGGIDIGAQRATPVRAPASGTVAFTGTNAEYGLTVIVDHGRDIRSVYGHLSKVSVRQGQSVERGTELGLSGNTGRSSGPHLHYEILVKGQAVNPRAYLWD